MKSLIKLMFTTEKNGSDLIKKIKTRYFKRVFYWILPDYLIRNFLV